MAVDKFPKEVRDILGEMGSYKESDAQLILRAFEFADIAHAGHKRYSGEPYIVHPVGAAKNLAQMNADAITISAGLLHDTLDDTNVSVEEIQEEFGDDILFLVKSVSGLGLIKYYGTQRHAESLRKLFIASAKDIRVVLIKLADRMDNVNSLEHVPDPQKRHRIALETLEIFAPIANRLGMGRLKGKLEDAAFKFVFPIQYKKVLELRDQKIRESSNRLVHLEGEIREKLIEHGLDVFEIDCRIKHLYSLWRKLERKKTDDINTIYDIVALRIVTSTVEDCYKILGAIHGNFHALAGRLKDYIAVPKANGYKSIHTVIFTGDGSMVEIQIRTKEMHDEAEFGIASHIGYDEAGKPKGGVVLSKKLRWIQQLIDWQRSIKESDEFIESLKTDFFKDRIFVFTPKGDAIELPEDAGPLDFAFAIHTDIGHHAHGAKVNDKFVNFGASLRNGDIVEIQIKESSRPTAKWLEYVKTSLAKRQIKNYLEKTR